MKGEHEIELKLAIPAAQLRRVIQDLESRHRPARVTQLRSVYYDTPRRLLQQRGCSLRIREADGKFTQTVKAPVPGPGGLQSQMEYNHRVPLEELDLGGIGEPALHAMLAKNGRGARLRRLFEVRVQRTTVKVKTRGTVFEVAADVGIIETVGRAAALSEAVSELEFELVSGDVTVMLDAALAINERYSCRLSFETKSARGYRLASGARRKKLTKASPLALDPAQTIRGAFLEVMGNGLSHLFANHVLAQHGDPGAVHQTRVAIRRIRAALRSFKSVLPYEQRKAFNGEFRWFLQRFSPARDWHIFLTESLPAIVLAGELDERAATRLRQVARRERAASAAEMIELVTSRRYNRLILRFQQWLCMPDCVSRQARKLSLPGFAAKVLRKSAEEMLVDSRPLGRRSLEEVHTLRKQGKKMRYATEFFSGAFAEGADAHYLAQLEKMQDLLGVLNDASVARLILAGIRGIGADDLLGVQIWTEQRLRFCLKAAQPHWRRLQREDLSWLDKGRSLRDV